MHPESLQTSETLDAHKCVSNLPKKARDTLPHRLAAALVPLSGTNWWGMQPRVVLSVEHPLSPVASWLAPKTADMLEVVLAPINRQTTHGDSVSTFAGPFGCVAQRPVHELDRCEAVNAHEVFFGAHLDTMQGKQGRLVCREGEGTLAISDASEY